MKFGCSIHTKLQGEGSLSICYVGAHVCANTSAHM